MKRNKTILSVMAALLVGATAMSNLSLGTKADAETLETSAYTVVEKDGVFQGIDVNESIDGGLYVGAKENATLSSSFLYGITTFQLGTNTVYDYDEGGIYLHLSTLGNTKNLNTRIYVFANDASGNVFFARGGNEGSATYPILQNGEKVGEFKGVKSSNICTIAPDVSGTVSIPWSSMTKSGSASSGYANTLFEDLHDWRVEIHTDLTSAGASAGEGVTVKSIGSYAKSGAEYQVVEGFNAQDVTYSYTGNVVNDAGVNFADIKSGSVVGTAKKHHTALSIKNYTDDTDGSVAAKMEYGRVVKESYVDEESNAVKTAGYKVVKDIAYENEAWTASNIAAPKITDYKATDSVLNMTDCTLVHSYAKIPLSEKIAAEDFFMHGASIRVGIKDKADGIRFVVRMGKSVYEEWTNAGATFGMALLPKDMVGAGLAVESDKAILVSGNDLPWTEVTEDTKVYMEATVCIFNIPEGSYGREISAVGYISLNEEYAYTTVLDRSITQVADAAYEKAVEQGDEEMIEQLAPYISEKNA